MESDPFNIFMKLFKRIINTEIRIIYMTWRHFISHCIAPETAHCRE